MRWVESCWLALPVSFIFPFIKSNGMLSIGHTSRNNLLQIMDRNKFLLVCCSEREGKYLLPHHMKMEKNLVNIYTTYYETLAINAIYLI